MKLDCLYSPVALVTPLVRLNKNMDSLDLKALLNKS